MVHLLAVILFAAATLVDSKPCPNATDISPCVCYGDTYNITDVICNNVGSVENLRNTLKREYFTETIPHLVLKNLTSSWLPMHTVEDLKSIDLEIIDGNITQVGDHAFFGQFYVTSLRLDRIRLENVPTTALGFVWRELKNLSMSGNLLKKLEHGSLSSFLDIERLTLSKNQISEIATISLPPNVQYLWISENKLTTFNSSLHHTKKLKHLDASDNEITRIKGEFEGVYDLISLKLDSNWISDISGSFSNLPSLTELSLAGNRILKIGEALVNLKHLSSLNLAQNKITNLNRTVFHNMKDLYDLNLSQNPLAAYQICPTLIPLRSLRKLRIMKSNVKSLSYDCFDSNTNLGYLDLSRNQLSALGLKYATNLITLDISYNNFRSLTKLELPSAGSATLILEDNQWLCSNETTSLLKDLDMRGYYFPEGYPFCLPISEKPQTCLIYDYGIP